MHKIIIFTDLDGTLLDEEDYRWDDALPALQLIVERDIPLIFCSSKTRAEIESLREQLGNSHPFITENGGGIYIPPGYFSTPFTSEEVNGLRCIRLGQHYQDVRHQFELLRRDHLAHVRGFSDMNVEEITALTGLSPGNAALARQRDFEEPFVFDGEPDPGFLAAIEAAGLNWTRGKIFHIMGQHDKGRAVSRLVALYATEFDGITSIGLGDNLNDLPMLEVVDYPVLLSHKDGSHDKQVSLPGLLRPHSPGPRGWSEALLWLLSPTQGAQGHHPKGCSHDQ